MLDRSTNLTSCSQPTATLFRGADIDRLFHYRSENIDELLLFATHDLDPERQDWSEACRRNFNDLAKEVCPDVLAVRLFTPEFCRLLISFSQCVDGYQRDKNKDAFAAPEITLRDISPYLERTIQQSVVRHLAPITFARWSVVPSLIHAPFLIRYSVDSQTQMERHHDKHSDVSISVNLNDDFEGGGLFFPRQNYSTKNLPVGSAVLFPGRVTHLHEGLPISHGQRFVLTVWTEHRE